MRKATLAESTGSPRKFSAPWTRASFNTTLSTLKREKFLVKLPPVLKQLYKPTNQKLGEGSFAEVYLGHKKIDKEPVAIKIMDKTKVNQRELGSIRKEIEILGLLEHENIVKILDSHEDEENIIVVMEYISGESLYDKITNSSKTFTEDDVRELIIDLVAALSHCKERGVIHRDIKPKNIMYTSEEDGLVLKLIDFNLSFSCKPEEIEQIELEDGCGTAKYVAPEIATGDEYGYSVDIWSLGVVAYVCSSGGYLPFSSSAASSKEMECILDKVEDGEWLFEPKHAWVGVSASLKDLISGMLSYEPETRMSYEDILHHDFITQAQTQARVINTAAFQKNFEESTNRLKSRSYRTSNRRRRGSFMRFLKF